MECKITEASAVVNEIVCETSVEQSVETDFTLPDYCPDIGRILKCRAVPHIASKNIAAGQLSISGSTKLEVIYVDGRDKHIRCCEHELPFNSKVPVSNCPNDAIASVDIQLEYVNCRAVSQRRVDIRGAFSMHIKVTAQKEHKLISDADGAGVRVRRQTSEISECAGRVQTPFVISESLELAEGKPPIASVIRSSAVLYITECKPITNKLILKGEAALKVVYNTEPEGSIETMEYSLPFNQFLDMNGVDDSCMTECTTTLNELNIDLRTDSDGEYRRMSVDIHAFADASAYRNGEITVIRDAYSVDCELNTERQYMNFEKFCGCCSAAGNADAELESTREITKVLDAWCEPGHASAVASGSGVTISGKLLFCTVFRTGDGDCDYAEKTVPFSCEIKLGDDVSVGHATAAVAVKSCTYMLSGSDKISIRAELSASSAVFADVQLSCITAVSPDESRVKTHSSEPALVVYFAEAGEELWDIAREFNASVENIQSENDLNVSRLEEKCMLLISVR